MMLHWRTFLVVAWGYGTVCMCLWLWLGPWPHDSWLRSPAGNQEHALEYLPKASMLQAAESCPAQHFGPDETYGYWVQDFQMVLRGPNPLRAFMALARRPEPMARIYGAIGLRSLGAPSTAWVFEGLKVEQASIRVSTNCVVEEQPIGQVINEIEDGIWEARLQQVQVDVH